MVNAALLELGVTRQCPAPPAPRVSAFANLLDVNDIMQRATMQMAEEATDELARAQRHALANPGSKQCPFEDV